MRCIPQISDVGKVYILYVDWDLIEGVRRFQETVSIILEAIRGCIASLIALQVNKIALKGLLYLAATVSRSKPSPQILVSSVTVVG